MSSFSGSPRLLKGGIVLIDPQTARVQWIVSLQYNQRRLYKTFGESPDRAMGYVPDRDTRLELYARLSRGR